MAMQRIYPELPAPDGADSEEGSGPSLVHWGVLLLTAAMRRKMVAVGVFLVCAAALVGYFKFRTPLYRVEASILVQPTTPLAHSSPEDPERSASALVHRRENLIDLIKQTNLLDAEPAPLKRSGLALPTWLPDFFGRAPASKDDPLQSLVLRLDHALEVTTGIDDTINIKIDWPNPQKAYQLVEAAQQDFLEARHVQEINEIEEVIAILQGQTAQARGRLDKVIDEVQRAVARDSAARDLDNMLRVSSRPDATPTPLYSEELATMKSQLDAKEHALADVEDFRRRRLADLQAQLDEKRGIYSDAYPAVVTLRQDIEALTKDSPQVAALRAETQKLRKDYAARLAQEMQKGPNANPSGQTRPARPVDTAAVDSNERVREARAQFTAMLDKLNAAQLELETSRAAFKHRYKVTWPAEVPTTPVSPKPSKVFGLGLFAALVFALSCAAAPDLLAGRIVQRWQVENVLELPVLAELNRG